VFAGEPRPSRRAATPRDGEIGHGVKAASTAFWLATLREQAAAKAWLQQGGFAASLTPADKFAFK
jgi:hypothetical protein